MTTVTALKSPKSLKELSCTVAARAGVLTDEILAQPDFRELIHRTLPKQQQIKLLGESHEYTTQGSLYIRALYDSSGFKHTQWCWYNSNILYYTSFSKTDTRLEITFLDSGVISDIEFVNPHGVGVELISGKCYMSLEPYFNGTPHGVPCYKMCLNTYLDAKNSSCERGYRCKCDGRIIEYLLYEQGQCVARLAMNLELD
jgi:hypothetical protein